MNNKILITVIVILSLIIVIAGGYFIQKEVRANLEQRNVNYFNNGTILGAQTMINNIIDQSNKCERVDLFLGNETLNKSAVLIDVRCLQTPEEVVV